MICTTKNACVWTCTIASNLDFPISGAVDLNLLFHNKNSKRRAPDLHSTNIQIETSSFRDQGQSVNSFTIINVIIADYNSIGMKHSE